MGNMLTTVTSNWFEVIDVNAVEAIVQLHNVRISDDNTHLECRDDSSGSGFPKMRITMSDNVNWNKYINHYSVFDLLAMLLTKDTQMVVDEIAYMDGGVAYQHQHQITYTAPKLLQSELYGKFTSDSLDVVLEALQSIQEQSDNMAQLCTVLGIPLPFVNCFHDEMSSSDAFEILKVICGLKDAPHVDIVLLFLGHQMLTKAEQDCGDIDSPSLSSGPETTLRWIGDGISEAFEDCWEEMDELVNPAFKKLYANGDVPQFIFDLWNPSIRGSDYITIDLTGVGLTSMPIQLLSKLDKSLELEFGDNQITDITDAAIRELVQFEDFCFDPNPIPEDRLEQINAYIKGLND